MSSGDGEAAKRKAAVPRSAREAKAYYARTAKAVVNTRWTRPPSAGLQPTAPESAKRAKKGGAKQRKARPASAPAVAYKGLRPKHLDDDDWWKPEWLKQPSRWRPERPLSRQRWRAHVERVSNATPAYARANPALARPMSAVPDGSARVDVAQRPGSAHPGLAGATASAMTQAAELGGGYISLNENFGPSRWRREEPLDEYDLNELITRLTKVKVTVPKPPVKPSRVVYEWNSDIMKHEAKRYPVKRYSPDEYTENIVKRAEKWEEDHRMMKAKLEEKWLQPIQTGKKVSDSHYQEVVGRLSRGMASREGPHWKGVKFT